MQNAKWKNGKWKIENVEQRTKGKEKWKMENGKWQKEKGK